MRYRSGRQAGLAGPIKHRRERQTRWRDSGAADLGAEVTNFLNQVVAKDFGGPCFAGALRLWNVVRCTERERLEADLRVATGQGRGHDDDEVALLREQQGQR